MRQHESRISTTTMTPKPTSRRQPLWKFTPDPKPMNYLKELMDDWEGPGNATTLSDALLKACSMVDRLRHELSNETATVNRVWKALGKHTYEECKPWAVWEWVAREKARADELQKQVNELIERL